MKRYVFIRHNMPVGFGISVLPAHNVFLISPKHLYLCRKTHKTDKRSILLSQCRRLAIKPFFHFIDYQQMVVQHPFHFRGRHRSIRFPTVMIICLVNNHYFFCKNQYPERQPQILPTISVREKMQFVVNNNPMPHQFISNCKMQSIQWYVIQIWKFL